MTTTSSVQPVRSSQHLGDVVRRHRTARRWTQQRLYTRVRAGLSMRTLQGCEHGDRAMSVDRLVDSPGDGFEFVIQAEPLREFVRVGINAPRKIDRAQHEIDASEEPAS